MTEALSVLAGVAVFGVGYLVGRYAGVTAGLRRSNAKLRSTIDHRSNPTYDRLTGYDRDRNA